MVDRLRAMNLEVTLRSTRPDELFTDLSQLQPFDTVLLANVPREHFSDDQIQMLVRNTQNMGSGLVMLGGPNSLAGGWTNTPVEEAMPVDFQIKNVKVGARRPVGHADARLGAGSGQLLAKNNRGAKPSKLWAIRTTAASSTGDSARNGCGAAGQGDAQSGAQPRANAGQARPHDSRRHARLRVVVGDGPRRFARC